MRASAMLAAVFLVLAAAVAGHAAELRFSIARMSSPLDATVSLDRALYMEVAYSSDVALRLQAQAFGNGAPIDAGQMMNASVVHPAGSGKALVWVAFREPAVVDEIRITAFDQSWNQLDMRSMPAHLAWRGSTAQEQRPGWVASLQAEEDRMAEKAASQSKGRNAGFFGLILGLIVMAGIPGYFVCQFLATRYMPGRWRLASLAPLILMIPLFGHALFAFASGSNIWPILVVLYAPVACAYLVGLYAARSMTRLAADAHR